MGLLSGPRKLLSLARLGRWPTKVHMTTAARNGKKSSKHVFEIGAESMDPFSYTSGRWLRNDAAQQRARYLKFDFNALCEKVLSLYPQAQRITNCQKKEGSFNRVFILQLDTGERIVARIPFGIAGPQRLATHSEVASILYLRLHSTIPVPKILDWSDDATNPTGTEYIIMEHVPGVQLHGKWSEMSTHQHMLCVKHLSKIVAEMANIQFPAYGSLYFSDAPFDAKNKIHFVDGFVIGPHVGAPAWPCDPEELAIYDSTMSSRGPWPDLESYCFGLIAAGRSRLPELDTLTTLPFRGTVAEHLRLLEISEAMITQLIRHPALKDISKPTMMHPDLHKRNIYVSADDPTQITALIDWQSTSIDPVFSHVAENPDFITGPPGMEYALDDEGALPGLTEEERKKILHDVSICRQTFEVVMQGYAKALHKARNTDERLLRLMQYCATSWRDSATALNAEIVDLSDSWHDLGLPGSSPYRPSDVELREYRARLEDFESSQKLRIYLTQLTHSNSEGWVPPDAWHDTQEAQKIAFQEWMSSATGPDAEGSLTAEKARLLWPYDIA